MENIVEYVAKAFGTALQPLDKMLRELTAEVALLRTRVATLEAGAGGMPAATIAASPGEPVALQELATILSKVNNSEEVLALHRRFKRLEQVEEDQRTMAAFNAQLVARVTSLEDQMLQLLNTMLGGSESAQQPPPTTASAPTVSPRQNSEFQFGTPLQPAVESLRGDTPPSHRTIESVVSAGPPEPSPQPSKESVDTLPEARPFFTETLFSSSSAEPPLVPETLAVEDLQHLAHLLHEMDGRLSDTPAEDDQESNSRWEQGRKGGSLNPAVYDPRYKTKLCQKWQLYQACPYGIRCQFAHGYNELQPMRWHHSSESYQSS